MKRVDLIKKLEAAGCVLVRHGGRHDWYRNLATGVSQPIPRHREIKERLAKRIMRMLSNDQQPSAEDPSNPDA